MLKFTALIGLLLVPSVALAAPAPISQHYVQPILDRADPVLNTSGEVSVLWEIIVYDWMWQIGSAVNRLINTDHALQDQEEELEITPCLKYDLNLIDERIELAREKLNEEFEAHRIVNIFALESLLDFLDKRRQHLVRGAHDQLYTDRGAEWRYGFDSHTWCCAHGDSANECELLERKVCSNAKGLFFPSASWCGRTCKPPIAPPAGTHICPFDSDYLPESAAGYGCSLEVLQALDNNLSGGEVLVSLDEEIAGVQEFTNRWGDFLFEIRDLQDLAALISGEPPPGGGGPIMPPHQRRIGCNAADGTTLEPPPDPSDPPPAWPKGAVGRSLRGAFSLELNHWRLLQMFDRLIKRQDGLEREQLDTLKFPDEYIPGSADHQRALIREKEFNDWRSFLRWMTRRHFRKVNENQAQDNLDLLVQAQDAQVALVQAFAPLRETVQEFASMASTPDRGLRLFGKRYALWLQQSCTFRPCQALLERIFRTLLADECFPYTDGSYVKNPRHYELCERAVR